MNMYQFWIDKPVPYCCRDCIPEKFQHKGQMCEFDMYKKVSDSFKNTCPKHSQFKKEK